MSLPTWAAWDEPMPWWVERCWYAWVLSYWNRTAPVPYKRSKHQFGR